MHEQPSPSGVCAVWGAISMSDSNHQSSEAPKGYEFVDDRPPVCPNGCGLLTAVGYTDMGCDDCGYVRTVIEAVEE